MKVVTQNSHSLLRSIWHILRCSVTYQVVLSRVAALLPENKTRFHARQSNAFLQHWLPPLFPYNVFTKMEIFLFLEYFYLFTKDPFFWHGIFLQVIFLVLKSFFQQIHIDEIHRIGKCLNFTLMLKSIRRWVRWGKKELGDQQRMANNSHTTSSSFLPLFLLKSSSIISLSYPCYPC